MRLKFWHKNTLILACAGLFSLLIIYLLISAGDLENTPAAEKKIEIADSTLRGYKDGRLLWSMRSGYIWSNLSIDHAVVENIYNGQFYDQDRLLLDKLSARKVQVNAPQERFYADKGFRAVMYRNYAPDQPVDVWGEQLNYSASDKKSRLQKQIQVVDRGTQISAERAEVDHSSNQITFGKDALLSRPDSSLTADSLLIDLNRDIFTAQKNVELIRQPEDSADEFKKQKTVIYTDRLQANVSKDTANLTMSGNILIKQSDKQAVGDQASFDEINQLFKLRGRASVVFDKTETLLDVTTRQKLKNKEILQEKLQLNSEAIAINTDTKDFEAEGSVQVTVKGKQASARKAVYKRAAEKIYISDNVLLRQADGSTVKAELVVVDIATEKFTAQGQAESTIYLQR
ncbi:MAG: hypothetical protein LBD99_06085 [Candidatus Margulisbacteria bacterium]|jgi:lipopolysaccharide export system protein LptA|nr:hypothetical protein [Candidatus Margulisiibacteriota bacterium]